VKWFKHMTDMSEDPRIKRIVRRHGGMAYAVYNYALERIAKRLETDSPEPDLEEGSEDIADFLKHDTVKVEEIMLSCIQEGLFDQSEVTGRIVCHKVYKFIDKAQTRSGEIRKLIDAYAGMTDGAPGAVTDSHGQSETVGDNPDRTEQNRTEQKNTSGADAPDAKSSSPIAKPKTGLAPLKDSLANDVEQSFFALLGQPYANIGKERGHVSAVAKRSRARSPDAPSEYARRMIAAMQYLRQTDNWWAKQPPLPSLLVSQWERVEAAIEHVEESAEVVDYV